MTVGQRIAKCRKNINISQEQLAEMMGVSRQAVSKWENNVTLPDTYNMIRLSKVLGADVEYLACGNEPSIRIPTPEKAADSNPCPEIDEDDEDDLDERERREKRKFWGFVLFVVGLIAIVRFFNPSIDSTTDIWWIRLAVLMIISIPCIFGLKMLLEKPDR